MSGTLFVLAEDVDGDADLDVAVRLRRQARVV